MIPNFSLTEILIILFIVLLLFGANRVPELGRSLGEGIKNFKKALTGEEEKTKEVKAQEKRDA
ncbi:MAG: twin-arginine translocase TatA/TatE family subunit [Aquificaceae bacterium]|nr:twin-arginine translocase TatA/TatE family subunit [Aquificaceae bacterium]MDW8236896.1 twin-arginine translocase TatA/TatE family subunit [Aquificaceae bacterium]